MVIARSLIIIYQSYPKKLLKINSLARVSQYMNSSKRNTLMNDFLESQFKYCPHICMWHSRSNNKKIDRLHKRCLRIQSSFKELLEKDSSFSIHDFWHGQVLATEMYKTSNNVSTFCLKEKLRNEPPYNLRQNSQISRPLVNMLELKIFPIFSQKFAIYSKTFTKI